MEYVIGVLVGIVAVSAFLFLFAKFGGNLNDTHEMNRALMAHWRAAIEEHRAEVAHLARIADAVEVWQARYVRRKGKGEVKGVVTHE